MMISLQVVGTADYLSLALLGSHFVVCLRDLAAVNMYLVEYLITWAWSYLSLTSR